MNNIIDWTKPLETNSGGKACFLWEDPKAVNEYKYSIAYTNRDNTRRYFTDVNEFGSSAYNKNLVIHNKRKTETRYYNVFNGQHETQWTTSIEDAIGLAKEPDDYDQIVYSEKDKLKYLYTIVAEFDVETNTLLNETQRSINILETE